MAITLFITRHPVFSYCVLAYAISWGGFVLIVGPDGFPGMGSQFDTLLPLVASVMLAGPAAAALLLTAFLSGKAGLLELLAGLLRWRVRAHWYVVALFTAPVLAAATLFALSLTAPIFTAPNQAAILLAGITAGLTTVLEEVGWTGFATPRLRRRYSVVATGLILGVVWGAWHLLQGLWVGGTYAGSIPLAAYLPLQFVAGTAQLTAYRVLMVMVYDRYESLLVATLMHASLTASVIFIFQPAATGATGLSYTAALAGAMWLVVAAVVLPSTRELSRRVVHRRMA
jgi:membrane protease YdiL (CAAX protease family)